MRLLSALTLSVGIVLLLFGLGDCHAGSDRDAAASRLFMNEDAWHFWQAVSGEDLTPLKSGICATRKGLEAYIDEIARGKITHFLMNVNGQRANFPVRSADFEPVWASRNDPERRNEKWVGTLNRLYDSGIDPYRIWIDRCRVKGVSPWISIRMNDIHHWEDPKCPNISTLWRQHPELLILPKDADSNGFDYTKTRVRERMIGFIREVLERYDPDGIELDLLRFVNYLPQGRERECAPVFTAFVRDVRRAVDAAAAKRGHGIALAVRVMAYPRDSQARGLQVDVWSKEGLVDFVMPCNFYSNIRYDISADEWRAWTGGRAEIVPGADSGVMESGVRRLATVAEYRKWAAEMRKRGAKGGLYLFNLFQHPQDGEVWNGILSQGLAVDVKDERGTKWVSVFNQDSTNFLTTHGDEKMNAAGIREYLDGVIGHGAFTHFFICPNAQTAIFDSKTMSPNWWRLTAKGKYLVRLDNDILQSAVCPQRNYLLHTNGVDIIRVYIDGCRAKGVSPWLSMRMNDGHVPENPQWWGHSQFWVDHPEYRREGGFDFSHPEVRAYHLAFVRELLERYDVDGFECDWMRFPFMQRTDDLTEMMREIRKIVNAAAKRRGHEILVGVRVSSRPAVARARATDTVGWAKEGLVDWVVPCNFFASADFELPLGEWKRLLEEVNPKVRVIPGTDTGVRIGDPVTKKVTVNRRLLTLAEYREWADRMQRQGADGIYIFNLFTYHEPAYHATTTEPWDVIVREGLSPEAIRGKAKEFPQGWIYEP